MAIFAAFGELIPLLGPSLAAIPAVVVVFLDSWQLGLAVAVFYVVLQQTESVVLLPLIMDSQANITPSVGDHIRLVRWGACRYSRLDYRHSRRRGTARDRGRGDRAGDPALDRCRCRAAGEKLIRPALLLLMAAIMH